MDIKDLSLTFHTNNIDECVKYYINAFDAKITFECDWYVTIKFSSKVNPYIFLSFMAPLSEKDLLSAGGNTLNIMVDDVDEEYKRIKSKGIIIMDDIKDHDWGDRSFSLSDPLGNILYIYSVRELSDVYKKEVKE